MERSAKSGKGWSEEEEGRAGRGSLHGYWDGSLEERTGGLRA